MRTDEPTSPPRPDGHGHRHAGVLRRVVALLAVVVSALTLLVASPASAATPVGSLAPGQGVVEGTTRLVMQTDGNLVLYAAGAPVWHARTNGHPGARFAVQGDGNLVVYGTDGRPLWQAGTWGLGATDLRLGPGTLSLLLPSGREVWRNGRALGASLTGGARLVPGEPLVSADRSYRLQLQGDGNLVLSRAGTAVWSTSTRGADEARVQSDGNIVLLDGTTPVWHTATYGTGPSVLTLQGDGNLVVHGRGRAVWDSRGVTGGAGTHLVPGAVPAWALEVPDRTRQVVRSVRSTRWCAQVHCAVTELWRKRTDGTWRQEAAYRSQSGPNGFSPMPRRAGDGTTPSGVFTIATTFSIYPTPPGRMPWKRRYPTSTVSGTAPYYNTWIEEPGRTDGTRPATEYGLWVGFNNPRLVPFVGPEPDPAIGSGIFVHTLPATARYIPSAGCIAIGERTQMLEVLRWLDPAAEPRIVFGR